MFWKVTTQRVLARAIYLKWLRLPMPGMLWLLRVAFLFGECVCLYPTGYGCPARLFFFKSVHAYAPKAVLVGECHVEQGQNMIPF